MKTTSSTTDRRAQRFRPNRSAINRIETGLSLFLAGTFTVLWFLAGHGVGYLNLAASPGDVNAMSQGWSAVLGIVLLIMLNGFFVSSETAIDVLRSVHVKHYRDEPAKAERIQHLLENKSRYVATCSVGSQIARLAMVFVAFVLAQGLAFWVSKRYGYDDNFKTILVCAAIIAVPVALLNLILGELVPKSVAALHPHRSSLRFYRFIRICSFLLAPFSALVVVVGNVITGRFGGHASFSLVNQAEEEIKSLVETAQESGEIEVDEQKLLHSVFDFTDTVAREVMTPRVDLDAVPIESEPADVVKLIQESGHSRIPLYEGTDDQIVSIVHAKDLFLAMLDGKSEISLRKLGRMPLFVPESKNIHELLAEMRSSRSQMAVVQDEFGGTSGIVTIEDIVEELVGDIMDEYDVEEPEFVAVDGGYLIEGRAHLDDVNAQTGSNFESDQFDTIGGLVFGLFGRQPKQGEQIEAEGHRITVMDSDGRRVLRLRLDKVEHPARYEDEDEETVGQ